MIKKLTTEAEFRAVISGARYNDHGLPFYFESSLKEDVCFDCAEEDAEKIAENIRDYGDHVLLCTNQSDRLFCNVCGKRMEANQITDPQHGGRYERVTTEPTTDEKLLLISALVNAGFMPGSDGEDQPCYQLLDKRGELSTYYSNTFKSFTAAKDWAVVTARSAEKAHIDIEITIENSTQLASIHEDLRVVVERRYVERGMHLKVQGPADIDPKLPPACNIGILEMIVWARLIACKAAKAYVCDPSKLKIS